MFENSCPNGVSMARHAVCHKNFQKFWNISKISRILHFISVIRWSRVQWATLVLMVFTDVRCVVLVRSQWRHFWPISAVLEPPKCPAGYSVPDGIPKSCITHDTSHSCPLGMHCVQVSYVHHVILDQIFIQVWPHWNQSVLSKGNS